MINIPENKSSQTIYKVQAQLEEMETPINTFKQLLSAVKDLDFSSLSDTVTKTRYLEAREKISEYYKNYIYMDVYAGSDMYEQFINYIITLFSVIDVLVDGRLDIMDMAKQAPAVVNEFLDSFGFEIRKLLDDSTNVDIAQNIYGYVRKKGTVQLLTMLLTDIGFSGYQVNEYSLNKIDDQYYITPELVYQAQGANFDVEPIRLSEVDDILRTLNEGNLDSIYELSPYHHMPTKTSYFSIDTIIDMNEMFKTIIALDIIRQYLEKQESIGEDVRLFALDGYGEKLTFRDLLLGYWMVFDHLYGENAFDEHYPPLFDFEGGQGLVGWNRTVTDPVVDIPKALALYDSLMPSAASARDKFTRLEVIKKLYYRTGSNNRFFTDEDVDSFEVLEDENEPFYNFILSKLAELDALAEGEKNVALTPGDTSIHKFDVKPYPTNYDQTNESYKYSVDLLNYNSAIIQSNKFYLTFLTSFEQIIYKYTKQIFPIKIYGTMAYLYNAYVKMIVKYVKPYHAKLLETDPYLKIGGPKDVNESVVVDDMMALSDINMLIYTDVIKWRYDNPYDWRPFLRDTYFEKIRERPLTMNWTTKLEDKEYVRHRLDDDYLIVDDEKRNHIYEDMSIKCDWIIPERTIGLNIDDYAFELYPSIVNKTYNKYDVITKNDDSSYTNNLDTDLILMTDNYAKGSFKVFNIAIIDRGLDSSAKFGILTIDTSTCSVYKDGHWKVKRIPVVNDILGDNALPEQDLSKYFTDYNDLVNVDLNYKYGFQNFLKFIVYVPAKSKFYFPKVGFVNSCKLY